MDPDPAGFGQSGYGVVVCQRLEKDVLTAVHNASKDARLLVLVVGSRGKPCSDMWTFMAAGASDVLLWQTDPPSGEQVQARLQRWKHVDELAGSELVTGSLVGASQSWRALVRQVVEIAAYSQGPVLIVGESGTGKELISRLIHTLDARRSKGDLVIVDCTTISMELSGSEFFGHERGAFTGAVAPRDGAFTLANGGTLFLDEIGELPLPLQAQLLRVIQEGKFKRVGANNWQHTQFRLIAATNRNLEASIAAGTFRADLYHRIAGWVCRTPSLRDRMDDVLLLARHFQAEFNRDSGCEGFDETVCQYLISREYPGNVRDLRRLVARLCHRHAGPGPITLGDVPVDERPESGCPISSWRSESFEQAIRRAVDQGVGLKEIGQAAEDLAIRIALEHEHRSVQRAADRLGVTPRTLQLRRAAHAH
ncbi:sigma-54-dependent Fis family transcriptional regulator [Microvirga aerilata]|uniref:Sigma-54-dependent Fis family transcriptional regulator n=1 Tax=Microvirga aerilata TaxID=670292 RepID=A0A937D4C7_9HYPH|nr:sigma 54-interacting transcriptional regulator [Microvirga aerilata]MBL0407385.1 sigma-54-dependent Fis family transcriptional regulator [Microvirga aerilata]